MMEIKDTEPAADKPLVPRDEKGRVMPGNKLAVGTSHSRVCTEVQALRRAFKEAVGPAELKAVILRHLELIQTASPRDAAGLIELLYTYTVGKPREKIDIDITDNTAAPTIPLNLTAEDITALERIRSKSLSPIIDVPAD